MRETSPPTPYTAECRPRRFSSAARLGTCAELLSTRRMLPSRPVSIPERIERRARWVLDSIGATELGFGDDLPYREDAWDAVEQLERPEGDDLAEAFFHLARLEELDARRDVHGRFRAACPVSIRSIRRPNG